jgi:hypothetical protein
MPFLTRGKTNWKYILIVLILAVIVGGGILGYWWLATREEIEMPEIKLPEKRILIDQKRWSEQIDNPIDLGEKFNTDPPTTKVLYTNPEKGVLLHIPYNPKWGTEKYKILPYYKVPCPDEHIMEVIGSVCEEGIEFGPPGFYETIREVPKVYYVDYLNHMYFLPARNAEEVVASLYYFKGGMGKGEVGVLEGTVAKDTINNIPVVKYTIFSFIGEYPVIEVIGKKYNYLFICFSYCDEMVLKTAEEIIGSIEFIE